jgi:hypothetical protein
MFRDGHIAAVTVEITISIGDCDSTVSQDFVVIASVGEVVGTGAQGARESRHKGERSE